MQQNNFEQQRRNNPPEGYRLQQHQENFEGSPFRKARESITIMQISTSKKVSMLS